MHIGGVVVVGVAGEIGAFYYVVEIPVVDNNFVGDLVNVVVGADCEMHDDDNVDANDGAFDVLFVLDLVKLNDDVQYL